MIVLITFLLLSLLSPNKAFAQTYPLEGFCTDHDIEITNHFECKYVSGVSDPEASDWAVEANWCDDDHKVDRVKCGGKISGAAPVFPCGEDNLNICCIPCAPKQANPDQFKQRGENCTPTDTCDPSQGLKCYKGLCISLRPTVGVGSNCFDTQECIQPPDYSSFAPGSVTFPTQCVGSPGICELVDKNFCYEDEDCEAEGAVCDLSRCVVEHEDEKSVYDPVPKDPIKISGKKENSSIDTSLCAQAGAMKGSCEDCFGNGKGVWTAIGCIPTEPVGMIKTFIYVGISIGGGVALISFISAGFLYTVSKGDPQKISSAKELMTSSVIGLLFVIFSITILQFIAADLLAIPGFGG